MGKKSIKLSLSLSLPPSLPLSQIWDLSDPTGKGYLDKQGLFTALRLVAACQLKREPSLASIMPGDPPPKLVGVDLNRWAIDVSI